MIPFLIISCEKESPLASDSGEIHNGDQEFLAKPAKQESYTYPIWGKMNFYNKRGVWQRGTILLSNGSKFSVETGALTPPHPLASSVYVTVRADFDSLNNEIVVSFTPSGCVFSPAAELILNYNDLGIDVAALYYIAENGDHIRQTPDHIDYQKKTITIYIDHFSRYAIGME
jgi:hypothetical protein